MANKVVHFEIAGQDAKKLQDFYSKLFDWNVDANNPMEYGMVDPSGSGVAGEPPAMTTTSGRRRTFDGNG